MSAHDPVDPFAPAPLGPVTLRNRFLKAATFEGMAEGNLVSERLIDFHRAMAAGGIGMTTLALQQLVQIVESRRGHAAEIEAQLASQSAQWEE